MTSVIVGPVLPEYVVNPSPWVTPVWPPTQFLADARCPYCGMPLAGTPAIACERGVKPGIGSPSWVRTSDPRINRARPL
jgi:hypothetical protein